MGDGFYFAHPSVSNSELKDLRKVYNGMTLDISEALFKKFTLGNIVDSYLTDKGVRVPGVTPEQERLAVAIVRFMRTDPVIKIFIDHMVGQFQFFKLLTAEYEGETFTIKARCKFDGFSKRFKIAVEYKTTSCTTQKSFVESIDFLCYDQGGAWYLDIAYTWARCPVERLWIIGVNPSTLQVFKFAMIRGDETHARGVKKYSFWSFKYIKLIDGFNA